MMRQKIVEEHNQAWNDKIFDLLNLNHDIEKFFIDSIQDSQRLVNSWEPYVIALSLHAIDLFRCGRTLICNGRDEATWIIIRSLSDCIIKMKWAAKRKRNAMWFVLDHAQTKLHIYKNYKRKSPNIKLMIIAFEERIKKNINKAKRNRYWCNQRQRIKHAPSVEVMANKSGLSKFYRQYFAAASESTHASHVRLERFLSHDGSGKFSGFIMDPIPGELMSVSYHLNNIYLQMIFVLQKGKNHWKFDANLLRSLINRHSADSHLKNS
jgi:hypothetical protein